MGLDTTISIAMILSVLSAIGVIVSIANTLKKNHENNEEKSLSIEKNFVKVNLKLDTFCDDMREMLKVQEKSNDELRRLSEQIVKDNERITTLFRYAEDHEARIKILECGTSGKA